jgi:glycosyltransferase involved in cell wall biosynthesis
VPNRTVLVVSHPNVVPHNQTVYLRLAELDWDVALIVPNRWRDEYSPRGFTPQAMSGLVGRFARVRTARPGAIQRHFYVTRPSRWLERWRPDVAFLEQEPFALPTFQWGTALARAGIPWGVQGDENLDRPFPWPARAIRHWTMPRAYYFAARSPAAGRILEAWGANGPIGVVPHTVPDWPAQPHRAHDRFTIGFAARLVPAKGVDDLLAALRRLDFPFRFLVLGDGPLRAKIERADLGHGELILRTGVRTDELSPLYGQMDVLVLPSRTTPTWAEQFGKVLCEALLCGVPVIGSSSGEIPWVIETTRGGLVFPEGDPAALASAIAELHGDPTLRAELARRGAEGVERHFSARVAARELDRLLRATLSTQR